MPELCVEISRVMCINVTKELQLRDLNYEFVNKKSNLITMKQFMLLSEDNHIKIFNFSMSQDFTHDDEI